MVLQQAPTFLPQAAGQKAICRIQRWPVTLKAIILRLGGTFTKAQIDMLRIKIGGHTIWEVTGSDLDKINTYKGWFSDAYHLKCDFSERDAKDIVGEEIGGLDLSKFSDDLFIEVDINAAAVAPTIRAVLEITPPQASSQGNGGGASQLIKKLIRQVSSSLSSGRQDIIFSPNGALLQRAFIGYTGADWTASADGNLTDLRVKKNGVPIYDDVHCLDVRELQQDYKKVPQSKTYVFDAMVDNNQSAAIITADARNLQIQPNLTAGDTLTTYFEVLDAPGNL